MKERRPEKAPYLGYLAGIATEVALTLVIFGVAFLIIFVLERLAK
ncbi:MAG: hypothetical protein Q8L35_06060 [Actinomycetota bacterium]|nr:hypothetical protein [Actinomycetota bacterium]